MPEPERKKQKKDDNPQRLDVIEKNRYRSALVAGNTRTEQEEEQAASRTPEPRVSTCPLCSKLTELSANQELWRNYCFECTCQIQRDTQGCCY
eukprot:CAMPEP_0119003228 /NCGR_PEP_ID=MMETSP1176-20130426/436_1 /TAXON_ID=265551 /ORGANISM="Synedropsis recta cf, Strain CCMP1620" /LENGTH=92 /DNA_ID=CAMNT_0006954805 /DNA_START=53 /DNA_END=331 /DNA_ORIENTATION=+